MRRPGGAFALAAFLICLGTCIGLGRFFNRWEIVPAGAEDFQRWGYGLFVAGHGEPRGGEHDLDLATAWYRFTAPDAPQEHLIAVRASAEAAGWRTLAADDLRLVFASAEGEEMPGGGRAEIALEYRPEAQEMEVRVFRVH